MADHNMDVHQKVFREAKKESGKEPRLRKTSRFLLPKKYKCDKCGFATNSKKLMQQGSNSIEKLWLENWLGF